MNSLVHSVRGYVLLQLQCYMPCAFPVCHPLYAAHYVAWHSVLWVARRYVAGSVAMARRCAAAAAALLVAAAAVVRAAAVAVESRSVIVTAGHSAGAVACNAR